MNTHYTLTFNNLEDYQKAKKQYHCLFNDKLKELYFNNHSKYNEVLQLACLLPYSFMIHGVQKINDLSSILFIIKKDLELSYKTIEVNASTLDLYESSEEEALIQLIDLPFIIYK